MPDISMCMGGAGATTCPRRDRCYRYTAEPTPVTQTYFLGLPVKKDERVEDCTYFWDNKP